MLNSVVAIGGIPAGPELLIILLVLILLFGANRIPRLARSTGQALGEFRKGREEIEDELQEVTVSNQETDQDTQHTEDEQEQIKQTN